MEKFFREFGPLSKVNRVVNSAFSEILFEEKEDAQKVVSLNGQLQYKERKLDLRIKKSKKKRLSQQDGPPKTKGIKMKADYFKELFTFPSENEPRRYYTTEELESRLDHRYYSDPKRLMALGMKNKAVTKDLKKEWEYYKNLNHGIIAENEVILNRTYPEKYFELPSHFKITTTSSLNVVREWIDNNIKEECTAVGIDTENDFIRYEHVDVPGDTQRHILPDLISISTEDACLLIQTNFYSVEDNNEPQHDAPDGLLKLLSNGNIKKIFFGVEIDLKKIVQWLHAKFSHQSIVTQFTGSIFNKQEKMGYVDMQSLPWRSLKKACSRVLGLLAEKSVEATFSRWSRRSLKDNQMQYAAQDACITLLVYKKWTAYEASKSVVDSLRTNSIKFCRT